MYIKELIYKNMGPIENIHITPSFTSDGFPKPLLLVGENGSGKSTLLSNIVDAFYEAALLVFKNIGKPINYAERSFYKVIGGSDISIGKNYMYAIIQFCHNDNKYLYLCKNGDINRELIQKENNIDGLEKISWDGAQQGYKQVTFDKKDVEGIWNKDVIFYYGPNQYEKPIWLSNKYYFDYAADSSFTLTSNKMKGALYNDITVKNALNKNLQWLFDVIVDSRIDVAVNDQKGEMEISPTSPNNLQFFSQARRNLEKIMSKILGEEIYFQLNPRNQGDLRLQIARKSDKTVIVPSLAALSTGQLSLFNIFATIIRYADAMNILQSFAYNDITGIVVVDEIELHLHLELQKNVLPKLIKMFPKIQFIIAAQAPLFVLGMEETLGADNYDIYELPAGDKITAEEFSELGKALEYLKKTQKYREDLENALKNFSITSGVLIITEGMTDWQHMETAYKKLRADPRNEAIFKDLNLDFFHYDCKLQMGGSELLNICEKTSRIIRNEKYIFIADADDKDINKKMMEEGRSYKKWGNNVFSFVIPAPEQRKDNPRICIEFLYSDEEIKTEYVCPKSNIKRRLFISDEFKDNGISKDGKFTCSRDISLSKKNKPFIIDGHEKSRVTRVDDDQTNYALSKAKFASLVLNQTPPFDNFNFDNFIPIFKTIKEIIKSDAR